jgi:hypothetical protein
VVFFLPTDTQKPYRPANRNSGALAFLFYGVLPMSNMSKSANKGEQNELAEIFRSMGDYLRQIRRAFDARFRVKSDVVDMEDPGLGYMWVKDIFLDHPLLGNALVVEHQGDYWAVTYEETAEGFDFADEAAWRKVIATYVYAEPETAAAGEGAGTAVDTTVLELAEASTGNVVKLVEDGGSGGPLKIDIAVIEPGWGNREDNHFYPRDMLKQCAEKFVGAKMYATNHRPDEKSVRTEVSQILEMRGFTETGAPIARVGVFDPVFAESIRNRAKLGILDGLHCSILARGSLAEGSYELNGRKGRKVAAITEVGAVDWVTQHGAGGRALRLAEAEDDMPIEETKKPDKADTKEQKLEEAVLKEGDSGGSDAPAGATPLGEAAVGDILNAAHLPEASKARIREQQWLSEYDLKTAVAAEINYIKAITGSGKVPAGSGGEVPVQETSLEEVNKRKEAVNAKFLGKRTRAQAAA